MQKIELNSIDLLVFSSSFDAISYRISSVSQSANGSERESEREIDWVVYVRYDILSRGQAAILIKHTIEARIKRARRNNRNDFMYLHSQTNHSV